MRLHLGCGPRDYGDGWTQIDAVPYEHVDVIHPVDDLPMIADGSVDLVCAVHVLEHFPRAQTLRVLREWNRVLAPGGVLRVAVPDFHALVSLYMDLAGSAANALRPSDRFGNEVGGALFHVIGPIIGGQRGIYDFHQNIFDEVTLSRILRQAGFRDPRRYDWRTTEHGEIDDYSQSYFPHLAHRRDGVLVAKSSDVDGRLLSLNMEATR